MDDVNDRGKAAAAKKLRGEIWEAEADGEHGVTYRLLFAEDGHDGQMLVGVVFFNKKIQKTPPRLIELAEARLADWRSRRLPPPDKRST
jgi:phage-related protein